jgi:hypothetical protein
MGDDDDDGTTVRRVIDDDADDDPASAEAWFGVGGGRRASEAVNKDRDDDDDDDARRVDYEYEDDEDTDTDTAVGRVRVPRVMSVRARKALYGEENGGGGNSGGGAGGCNDAGASYEERRMENAQRRFESGEWREIRYSYHDDGKEREAKVGGMTKKMKRGHGSGEDAPRGDSARSMPTQKKKGSSETASPESTYKPPMRLCELRLRNKTGPAKDVATIPTMYAVLDQGVTPEGLLQGGDAEQWKQFGKQGAMVLKLRDAWDILDDTSALCDLSWIGTKKLKLRTLGPDYQYLRQNLPNPVTGVLEPFGTVHGADDDTEIGAFVEDFQEQCRAHAEQFRLMSVDARESWFLQQVHAGFPLQFPYLQGIALEALLKNVRNVENTPMENHPWDPRFLGERPPSVLRQLLTLCEASSQHGVKHALMSDAVPSDVKKVEPEEERHEEFARAGARVHNLDAGAVQRRVERREKKKKGERHTSAGRVIEAASIVESVERASASRLWGVGIVSPWLYYMGMGSIFPLHFEDYAFASANVIIAPPDAQAWVVWYSIPRSDLYALHKYLQETLGSEYSLDILEMRRLWLDPMRIQEWNKTSRTAKKHPIRVYRHVQGPGDYVITDYGSVHWGVNLGHGWKAAVNFAYMDWKPAAEEVDKVYSTLEEERLEKRHHRCCPQFAHHADLFSETNILSKFKSAPYTPAAP